MAIGPHEDRMLRTGDYARLAEQFHRKAEPPVWKRTLLDLAVSVFIASVTAGVLSVSAGTLASMTGLMAHSRSLLWIFLGLFIPFTCLSFAWFTRDSRSRRKAFEDDLRAAAARYPDFPAYYQAWKQKKTNGTDTEDRL
jgi:hypothetical protein